MLSMYHSDKVISLNGESMTSTLYPFESILNASSLSQLTESVAQCAGEAGFSSFHYGAHSPFRADGDKARFLFDGAEQKSTHVVSGYSDAWFVRYQAENYIEIDPLVKRCSQSILPMVWDRHAPPRRGQSAGAGLELSLA